jgi:3-phosphoshikimate 1-carboxyvinyltransferase
VNLEISNVRELVEPTADITVRGGTAETGAVHILSGDNVAKMIDEIPILAVLGTQLSGGLEIRGAGELRHKESDRIKSIVDNLRAMGARVSEFEDGLRVEKSQLKGTQVDSRGDHRIAMAFAVAGLLASGETEILGAECADISYPGFFSHLGAVTIR